jgi:hypothetical protein
LAATRLACDPGFETAATDLTDLAVGLREILFSLGSLASMLALELLVSNVFLFDCGEPCFASLAVAASSAFELVVDCSSFLIDLGEPRFFSKTEALEESTFLIDFGDATADSTVFFTDLGDPGVADAEAGRDDSNAFEPETGSIFACDPVGSLAFDSAADAGLDAGLEPGFEAGLAASACGALFWIAVRARPDCGRDFELAGRDFPRPSTSCSRDTFSPNITLISRSADSGESDPCTAFSEP